MIKKSFRMELNYLQRIEALTMSYMVRLLTDWSEVDKRSIHMMRAFPHVHNPSDRCKSENDDIQDACSLEIEA